MISRRTIGEWTRFLLPVLLLRLLPLPLLEEEEEEEGVTMWLLFWEWRVGVGVERPEERREGRNLLEEGEGRGKGRVGWKRRRRSEEGGKEGSSFCGTSFWFVSCALFFARNYLSSISIFFFDGLQPCGREERTARQSSRVRATRRRVAFSSPFEHCNLLLGAV